MNKLQKYMLEEVARLETAIKNNEQVLNESPDGELKCYKFNDYYRWYILNEKDKKKRRRYLNKSEQALAESLALKGFIKDVLKDEKQELNAIQLYLRHCSEFERGNTYFGRNEEYARLLEPHSRKQLQSQSAAVQTWLDNYQTNPDNHPEELRVMTRAGFMVRSKTERDILHALIDHHVPFKYEHITHTDIGDLEPDFTILHPTTGEEFIWEHNGSMDDPNYARKVLKRTAAYYRLGFHPGKNFIMTFEENNAGLDTEWIEAIIHQYFLDPISMRSKVRSNYSSIV